MKKFLFALAVALVAIDGTVALTHYVADKAQVMAEPGGN
jgi:hypothetical protein